MILIGALVISLAKKLSAINYTFFYQVLSRSFLLSHQDQLIHM